ncbi:hypothetical protein N8579_00200 [bacterium]|nr:hypothetical protein [bacterium]
MSDFNYQEYLKNNPLLKEEVKDQLITEGLNEDKYDDIVAADDDIPADQKKAAASAYRKVDKGASAEKALKNVKEEEVTEETTSKMKVSELKAKIKEDIISLLNEDEEEVDIEDEIEADDVEVDMEEPSIDATPSKDVGLSSDEQEIQDSLKLAYDNAVAIGDEKLADQIGNSITFFTRTHVVER